LVSIAEASPTPLPLDPHNPLFISHGDHPNQSIVSTPLNWITLDLRDMLLTSRLNPRTKWVRPMVPFLNLLIRQSHLYGKEMTTLYDLGFSTQSPKKLQPMFFTLLLL